MQGSLCLINHSSGLGNMIPYNRWLLVWIQRPRHEKVESTTIHVYSRNDNTFITTTRCYCFHISKPDFVSLSSKQTLLHTFALFLGRFMLFPDAHLNRPNCSVFCEAICCCAFSTGDIAKLEGDMKRCFVEAFKQTDDDFLTMASKE